MRGVCGGRRGCIIRDERQVLVDVDVVINVMSSEHKATKSLMHSFDAS